MRMRTGTSHYSLDRYHYYPLGGAEEVQCRCSAEVIVQVTVQEVQRMCKVQRWDS